MKLAIIGTGKVGGTLAGRFADKGHEIILGSRRPGSKKVKAILDAHPGQICAKSIGGAADIGEVLIIAVPPLAIKEVMRQIGRTGAKIIIDCCNQILDNIPHFDSTSVAISKWANSNHVVKCFNTTGVENMNNPKYGRTKLDMFICGDNPGDKLVASQLAEQLGFEVVDIGGLEHASNLECIAKVWVALAYEQKFGTGIGFKLLRR